MTVRERNELCTKLGLKTTVNDRELALAGLVNATAYLFFVLIEKRYWEVENGRKCYQTKMEL